MEHICPHCKQEIYEKDALLCHFCGKSLERKTHDVIGKITPLKILIAVVVLIAVMMSLLGKG